MTPPSSILFAANSVSFSYGNVLALQDLSLSIERGERIALLGANGSGKSTLFRLLAALAFPDRGSICYLGHELTAARLQQADFFYDFRRSVGVVFQNPDVQLFNPSVFDEVAFGPLQLGWAQSEIRSRVEQILSILGISSLASRAPHRLSGGEKKRVALASVLVTEPQVLLLDEPIESLDPTSQNGIIDLLSSMASGPRTVITATHDLNALESIADRCVVLKDGAVAGEGGPYTILHDAHLLEQTGLVRPHRHHHPKPAQPHGHLHTDDLG
ncbi:MAG: energy-coupling factor ABC transporter ATP-binding protein [Acidobacteriota bacterium]|nr:energy-coupling factor ABC transporter ATP-binding protein [Acidobacteriota bacterium]